MGTLNRKKHFGIVYGIAPYSFLQDGKYFNQAGEEVDKDGRVIGKPEKLEIKEYGKSVETTRETLDKLGIEVESEKTAEARPDKPNPPEAGSPGATSSGSTQGEGGDGYGTRDEVIAKLEELKVPYNAKARRSQLIELLKGREG